MRYCWLYPFLGQQSLRFRHRYCYLYYLQDRCNQRGTGKHHSPLSISIPPRYSNVLINILEESMYNWTVIHNTGITQRCAIGICHIASSCHPQHFEFTRQSRSDTVFNAVICPGPQIEVPERRIICQRCQAQENNCCFRETYQMQLWG